MGSWTIPLFALPTLMADIPFDVSGRSQVTVSLIAMDGSLLAQAQTMLIVDPTSIPAPTEDATAAQLPNKPLVDKPATNPAKAPVLSTLSVEERTRAEHLVAQGEKYLGDANIEAARQFFRRAADAGLAVAALRLAATYDPAELVHLQAEGVVANRAEARRWYERARELGATEAEADLQDWVLRHAKLHFQRAVTGSTRQVGAGRLGHPIASLQNQRQKEPKLPLCRNTAPSLDRENDSGYGQNLDAMGELERHIRM
jgi:TPR repeat protein